MELKTTSSIFEHLSLSTVHHRFLCGSSALRDTRQVSRMRLYLAMAQLDDEDLRAQMLVSDIRRYEAAKTFLLTKKQLTVKDLLKAHNKILPDAKHSGKLRTVEGWVGKSRELATYIAPSANKILPLLNDFILTLNSHNQFSTEDIIQLYSQFLTIHPFCDGNGRMSRLLVDYMQQRADLKTHFSLFRLGMNIDDYQSGVLAFGVRSNLGIKSPYWQKMITWVTEYESKSQLLLKELQTLLTAKVALSPLNSIDLKVISLLLKHPVVNLNTVYQTLKLDVNSCRDSLSKLVATKILNPYRTKSNTNTEVLVCRDICQFTMQLDELLFKGKELAS